MPRRVASLPQSLLAMLPALLASACQDAAAPLQEPPTFLISDAAHTGKPHFYFLPPMVPNPGTNGGFDGELSPNVVVCVLSGSTCDAVIATFTTTTGPGSETVRVEPAGEHYLVNWHTDAFNLDPALTYRIRVVVDDVELGFADVDVVSSGRELKNVVTGEYIPLLDGRTLPIKFRVEQGFLARITVVPAEATVQNGNTQQFTAELTDLHGAALSGIDVTWASDDDGIATVDQDGLATGTGSGSTGITAVAAGVAGRADLTVAGGLIIAAGGDFACAVKATGQAYCWGNNFFNQLGSPGPATATPRAVATGLSFRMVSVAGIHACGVTTSLEAYCWGGNGSGELGDGTTTFRAVPTPVATTLSFTAVAASSNSTCGLTTGGQAYCWGNNFAGQLGDGTTTGRLVPTLVTGGHSFTALSGGLFHVCGLTTGGQARCWGQNNLGQLGDGTTANSAAPVATAGDLSFETIAAGNGVSCGTVGGQAYCWGNNSSGQLGDGTTANRLTPTMVAGTGSYTALATGNGFTCGVTTSGAAHCWGSNGFGQLGDGSTTTRLTPVPVFGVLTFASLTTGLRHTCGATVSQQAYCWGQNSTGQLGNGDGSGTNKLVPSLVLLP